mmetsp:Transcript_39926/g.48395  ORF Transcript_39926/g.48395 Transcript_39926/m.48395 type:complete len:236 (-) Transcript_39926:610-1317(-)
MSSGQNRIQKEDMTRSNVPRKFVIYQGLLLFILFPLVSPVHQYLPNFDPFAACTQSILHRLPTADNAYTTESFSVFNTNILHSGWGTDLPFTEWQLTQTVLYDQPDQPIGIEDEICFMCVSGADNCMHSTCLIVAWEQVKVGVDPAQVVLSKLGTNVLDDKIYCYGVIPSCPGNDYVGDLFAGSHKLVEHRLNELGVLRDYTVDVASSLNCITLDASSKSHVIVCIYKYLHVQLF